MKFVLGLFACLLFAWWFVDFWQGGGQAESMTWHLFHKGTLPAQFHPV